MVAAAAAGADVAAVVAAAGVVAVEVAGRIRRVLDHPAKTAVAARDARLVVVLVPYSAAELLRMKARAGNLAVLAAETIGVVDLLGVAAAQGNHTVTYQALQALTGKRPLVPWIHIDRVVVQAAGEQGRIAIHSGTRLGIAAATCAGMMVSAAGVVVGRHRG